jgi:SAM-dependent methyltransferase
LPAELSVTAGPTPLFSDPRLSWIVERFGGVEGRSVLELGPLEGGHTTMLERAGAEVIAVEANTRAYLKCLITKELVSLRRSTFLLGDFLEYLRSTDRRFDAVLASGVLYHAPDPLELLEAIAAVTDRVGIWTHYYDDSTIRADPRNARMFLHEPEPTQWRGHEFVLHRRAYREALQWGGFCGGPEPTVPWMELADLLTALEALGLSRIDIGSDDPGHLNGPAVLLCASRP